MATTSSPRTGYPYLDAVLDQPGSVLAMAHRGGAGHADLVGLENTAQAFRHAVQLGYRYLETDVHATRDGVLVAFHDPVIDRVTDRTGRVEQLSSVQLGEALIGGLHAVPRFVDLLEELPDARFNVDLKSDGAVHPLADLLRHTDSRIAAAGSASSPRASCAGPTPRACTSTCGPSTSRRRCTSCSTSASTG